MAILNGQEVEMRMKLDGTAWMEGTCTSGTIQFPCFYSKSNGIAFVVFSMQYPSAGTGADTITLPTELQGFTESKMGMGQLWATGNFSSHIAVFPDTASGLIRLNKEGATYHTLAIGQMFLGYCILKYSG